MAEGIIESSVEFKEFTDMTTWSVTNDNKETVAEISGYGLNVKFNMGLVNSQEAIDATAIGIAEIFKELWVNELIRKTS